MRPSRRGGTILFRLARRSLGEGGRKISLNTGAAKANVAIDIRRGIVQVQRERPIIRRIVPIATADRRAN